MSPLTLVWTALEPAKCTLACSLSVVEQLQEQLEQRAVGGGEQHEEELQGLNLTLLVRHRRLVALLVEAGHVCVELPMGEEGFGELPQEGLEQGGYVVGVEAPGAQVHIRPAVQQNHSGLGSARPFCNAGTALKPIVEIGLAMKLKERKKPPLCPPVGVLGASSPSSSENSLPGRSMSRVRLLSTSSVNASGRSWRSFSTKKSGLKMMVGRPAWVPLAFSSGWIPTLHALHGYGDWDWGATYTSSNVCALRGSTVEISCTYKYPKRLNGQDTTVQETLWFNKTDGDEYVDLQSDTDYADRVEYSCGQTSCNSYRCNGKCTLSIRDLRLSDSAAEYKFRFTTNQPGGNYYGNPGVTLSVTDLQVKVSFPYPTLPTWANLECHSMCGLAGPYIWTRRGQSVGGGRIYWGYIRSEDIFSCAVEGYEHLPSPPVCKLTPQCGLTPCQGRELHVDSMNGFKLTTPSVTVRPFGEIEEGSSVTLSCSSDANPAANYTWFKVNPDDSFRDMNQTQQLVFGHIKSSDSGQYLCEAKNELGNKSVSISIIVKYGPKHTSVTSSPSGGVKEGSSVTLSCSSDANPAANYTWFKEHEDSVIESGQNYTITDITSELGGNYYCQAHNAMGRHNSTFLLINVTETSSSLVVGTVGSVAVLLAIILLLVAFLWMRRKRASRKASALGPDTAEEPLPVPVYGNVLTLTNCAAPAAQREPIERQDDLHYASIHFSHSENQEGPRCSAEDEVLYSVVKFKIPNSVPEVSEVHISSVFFSGAVTRQRWEKPQSYTATSKNTPEFEPAAAAGFK
ncbi:B-cell receptor CD22 [Merluccius polli]|uniref:B-cell receptor CD22 n=1 Tax=Merluccius polli TaxID=89951 RepID=A0AA47N7Y2_MERPO|nr:B-cell receptor CD22 [Merluccius polli]